MPRLGKGLQSGIHIILKFTFIEKCAIAHFSIFQRALPSRAIAATFSAVTFYVGESEAGAWQGGWRAGAREALRRERSDRSKASLAPDRLPGQFGSVPAGLLLFLCKCRV